ncbi:MAG TPA: glycoside hydrolase family 6 protein [Candidatus Paceibacterota bacterium]
MFIASALSLGSMMMPGTAMAAGTVETWWPAQNASVQGTQPFKAIVKDMNVWDYKMYWSVDGGSENAMYDSWQDYQHKEAMVDLTNWKWNSNGSYNVAFIARSHSGAEIARTSVTIKNAGQSVSAPTPAPIVVAPTPAPAPAPSNGSEITGTISAPVAQTPSNATAPAPAPTPAAETATLEVQVASPKANTSVYGKVKISASVPNKASSSYKMYWSVDGGSLNQIGDQSEIDFTYWTWKGSNAYVLNFIAKDNSGNTIAKTDVPVYANAAAPASGVTAAATAPATNPVTNVVETVTNVISSLTSKLYVDPNNPALAQAKAWKSSRPADAAVMEKIGSQSSGIWLGNWNADVQSDVQNAVAAAKKQNASAVFVAYNIPGRDCGQYSAGGLSDKNAYVAWIKKIAAGIGSGDAIVILEPDAIALTDCLSDSQKTDRYSMISQAVEILSANSGTKVYIDAGHSGWVNASDMASRLSKAGVSKAAGFSLNVSNYVSTGENTTYGTAVSKLIGNKHFVIDTSRNGSGSNGEWCNPSGRSLGQAPTLSTGNSLIDAYLWAKKPGESDGNCNGGPNAGEWWPEYALGLAQRAGY